MFTIYIDSVRWQPRYIDNLYSQFLLRIYDNSLHIGNLYRQFTVAICIFIIYIDNLHWQFLLRIYNNHLHIHDLYG